MSKHVRTRRRSLGREGFLTLAIVVSVWCGCGCKDDARLAGHRIPKVTVGPVRDQGLELGAEASPEEVVFVLLRAIRDDLLAGVDQQARRQALERQFAVCDPDYIYDWYRRSYGRRAAADRDEWVYKKVTLWAPALGCYVDSFDLDLETGRSRMSVSPTSRHEDWPGETVQVDLPVRGPAGQVGAETVVRVRLHRHASGYWRVFQVGFAKRRGLTGAGRASAPTAATSGPALSP